MVQRARWAVVAAVMTGCSEDAMPLADFAELCGQDGPVQILPLETDEVVGPTYPGPHRLDERTYYGIRRFDHPITNVSATGWPADSREYAELDARIDSIGPCGEDRRTLAEGVDRLIPPTEDDEPWLAQRSETRELFWIDIDSNRAPIRVREGPLQRYVVRGHHIWELDEDNRQLIRHTLADDRATSEVVFEDAASMWPPFDDRGAYEHERGELLVLLANGELLALDVETGERELVDMGMDAFAADPTLRWILKWNVEPGSEAYEPTDAAFLFERGGNASHGIGVLGQATSAVSMRDDIVVLRNVCASESGCSLVGAITYTELTVVPGLQSVRLDGGWQVQQTTRAGTFTVLDDAFTEIRAFVVDGDELREFASGDLSSWLHDDALWTKRCEAARRPCDVVATSASTGEEELIEADVWSDVAVPGRRWVEFDGPTPDPGQWRQDPRGELVLLDDRGGATLIDRQVSPEFEYLVARDPLSTLPWHTDEIVYQVRSLRDDRTGLWRARFE